MKKIIRTICLFRKEVLGTDQEKLESLQKLFEEKGFVIQTKRLCSPQVDFSSLEEKAQGDTLLSIGQLDYETAVTKLEGFYKSKNVSFNVELAQEELTPRHTEILFEIIKNAPSKTFNFTYTFNNVVSSPYFPSAVYEKDGFAIGLQPTDLSEGATTLEDWFSNMKQVWDEIVEITASQNDFLGIDSSVAPLFEGSSSLVNFVKKLGMTFEESVLTDTYLKTTRFIKEENPGPVGLNGLMFPALEDFDLAKEYEQGNFSLERNLFLSLHSGLGIDTYPIGVDEAPEKVLGVLKVVQGLSNKHKKPLSTRFVSDGKAKVGEVTDFQNQYLKDIKVRSL